jgi:hypothetical protein
MMAPKTDNIVIFNGTPLALRTSKKICTYGEVEGLAVGFIMDLTGSFKKRIVVGDREKKIGDASGWVECELGSKEKGCVVG